MVTTTKTTIPDFGTLRGLKPDTISLCKIEPNGRGWHYPCWSLDGQISIERWKAAPGYEGPKYAWSPEKNDQIKLYDPDGKLKDAVQKADGFLYLTGGDVATMSLFNIGIRHATNLFGDTAVLDRFISDMKFLNVAIICAIPDRDESGRTWAYKLRDLCQHEATFTIEFKQLPYPLEARHGKDLNDWIQDGNKAINLSDLPVWKLAEKVLCVSNNTQYTQLPEYNLKPRIQAVVQAIEQQRPILKRNGDWLNFQCLFHEDRVISAGFNTETGAYKCFAACEGKNLYQMEEHFGLCDRINTQYTQFKNKPVNLSRVPIVTPDGPAETAIDSRARTRAVLDSNTNTDKKESLLSGSYSEKDVSLSHGIDSQKTKIKKQESTNRYARTYRDESALRPPLPDFALLKNTQLEVILSGRVWLDQYLRWGQLGSPLTPDLFHEGIALHMLATAVNRRLKLRLGTENIYGNLYVMIVAKTSLYRKTTAMNMGKQVLRAAGLEHMLLPVEVTPEALFDELSGVKPPNWDELPSSQQELYFKGRMFAAQRSFFKDEMSSIFAGMKRDYMSGFAEMLMSGYGGDDRVQKRLKSKGMMLIENVCLSMLGSTTPAMYGKHIGLEETGSGFVPRFAILTPDRTIEYKNPADDLDVPKDVVARLRQLFMHTLTWNDEHYREGRLAVPRDWVEELKPPPCQSVAIDSDALALVHQYRRAMHEFVATEAVADNWHGNYARLGTMLVKVALLLAAIETRHGSLVRIEIQHMAAAHEIVERWRESLHRVDVQVARAADNNTEGKVYRVIADSKSKGITARELMQQFNIRPKRKLDEMIDLLRADGKVIDYSQRKSDKPGRPPLVYRLAEYLPEATP